MTRRLHIQTRPRPSVQAATHAAPTQRRQAREITPLDPRLQVEPATRLGHHFGRVAVSPPAAGPTAGEPIQARAAEERPSGQHLAPAGRGKPLPEAVQTKMEQAFGQDFSGVRMHEGRTAESIGAVAFTRGQDIHFTPGKYSPASRHGQELIGHELAHVVQQRAGRVAMPQGKGAPINADPSLEAEADQLGKRAVSSIPVNAGGQENGRVSAISGGGHEVLQRMEGSDGLRRRRGAEEPEEEEARPPRESPGTVESLRRTAELHLINAQQQPRETALSYGPAALSTGIGSQAARSHSADPVSAVASSVQAAKVIQRHVTQHGAKHHSSVTDKLYNTRHEAEEAESAVSATAAISENVESAAHLGHNVMHNYPSISKPLESVSNVASAGVAGSSLIGSLNAAVHLMEHPSAEAGGHLAAKAGPGLSVGAKALGQTTASNVLGTVAPVVESLPLFHEEYHAPQDVAQTPADTYRRHMIGAYGAAAAGTFAGHPETLLIPGLVHLWHHPEAIWDRLKALKSGLSGAAQSLSGLWPWRRQQPQRTVGGIV